LVYEDGKQRRWTGTYGGDHGAGQDPHRVVVSAKKKKKGNFQDSTTSKCLKVTILTILPKSWRIRKSSQVLLTI
jgi:hypothetical protein